MNSRLNDESLAAKRQRHSRFVCDSLPQLAGFAWEGLEESGRGAVIISPKEEPGADHGCEARYLSSEAIRSMQDEVLLAQVGKYDPQTQIVVAILEPDGSEHSYVVSVTQAGRFGSTPSTAGMAIPEDYDLVGLRVSRENVEAANLEPVLTTLRPRGILEPVNLGAEKLCRWRGSQGILIDGYNEDPRELYLIPEVRLYWQKLHKAWPYGLYFLSPQTGSLQLLVLSHIDFKAAKHDSASQVLLRIPTDKVMAFLTESSQPYLELCQAAGLSPGRASRQLCEIAMLFGVKGGRLPQD